MGIPMWSFLYVPCANHRNKVDIVKEPISKKCVINLNNRSWGLFRPRRNITRHSYQQTKVSLSLPYPKVSLIEKDQHSRDA